MSTTIDEKVVEMRFDNRQFEQGVQASLDTISDLRQSLNLEGASKGLESISAAAKKVDLSSVASAAETIGLKFSAMYTIADQALRNITNSAMNYGKRIADALTIEPIRTGLSEYETQINAVQTILANTESKGSTLDDVNGALDELNKYADKTIYNFTEMTRNIGTFTAAGVDLDTSVKSIQGIANLAAISGSSSQQASTAMYQLSQALASGKVSLMDWNSVVNAGMGGQVFQDALKRTATNMGTDVDALIKKYGSFRESLTQGEWLTADVLTKTLEQFTMAAEEGSEQWEKYKESLKAEGYTDEQAEAILKMANTAENAATKVKTFSQLWDTLKETAQSGWTQTWEILVGDFEEAKETLSKASEVLGDIVNKMSESRNALLQGWKDLGGREVMIEAIANAFHGLMNILKPIGEAFREIFPALKPEQLLSFSEAIRDITETFKNAFNPELESGKKNADNLKRTFKGLFAAVDIVKEIFVAVVKAVASLFGGVGKLGGGILGITATIGDWIVKLRDAIKSSDIFNKALQGIVSIVKKVAGGIAIVIEALHSNFIAPGLEGLKGVLSKIVDGFLDLGDTAGKAKDKIVGAFKGMGESLSGGGFFEFISTVWKGFMRLGSGVVEVISTLASGAAKAFGKLDFSGLITLINAIAGGGIAAALLNFSKGFGGVTDSISEAIESFGSITGGVVDILDGVKGSLEAYQSQLKAGTLMKIAGAIAILTASLVILSCIDGERLGVAIGAMTALFTELMVSLAIFSRISGDITGVTKSVGAMIGISTAVLILSAALKNMASLDGEELATGLLGIAGLSTMMVLTAKALSKDKKAVIKGATQMIIFATALKILASVCETLAMLNWDELAKGLLGVGVLLAEVSLFLKNAKFGGKAIGTATGIVILSAAIKILASACNDFAQIPTGGLVKGLASVAVVLATITAFTKITSGATNMVSIGIGMVAIAGAVKIFASAVQDLGSMSLESIGKGLLAMAGALLAITLAVNFMPKDMALTGLGMVVVATGLTILAGALSIMGGMSAGGAFQSLAVLAGSLLILSVGLNSMTSALPGVAALLLVSPALIVLAAGLRALGSLDLMTIGVSLLTLVGVFTVLGLAGYILAPIVPVIISLAGALALVGVAALGIGLGLSLAGAGIATLAAALATGATAIVAGLTTIVVGILALVPAIIAQLGAMIVAICEAIAGAGSAICQAIATILVAIAEAIMTALPPLMECLTLILTELINLLITFIPQFIDAGLQLIVGLLEGIASHIADIVELAITIIAEFIQGIAAGLPKIIQAGIDLIISFINGLADGIRNNTDTMIAAVDNLMNAMMEAIGKWFGGAIEIGFDLVCKLVSGLLNGVVEVAKGAGQLITTLIDGIKKGISGIFNAGKELISGFINGIKDGLKAVGTAAAEIGSEALSSIKSVLGIASPSKEFAEIGKYSGQGLVKGLKSYSGKVSDTADGIGASALDAMRSAVSGIGDAINGDLDSDPTIRPVLDLSDIESGASAISGLLGKEQSVGVMANVGAISSAMRRQNQNGTTDDVISAIGKLGKSIAGMGGTSYNINGITYDDGSNVSEAIKTLVRAAKLERRVN